MQEYFGLTLASTGLIGAQCNVQTSNTEGEILFMPQILFR